MSRSTLTAGQYVDLLDAITTNTTPLINGRLSVDVHALVEAPDEQ